MKWVSLTGLDLFGFEEDNKKAIGWFKKALNKVIMRQWMSMRITLWMASMFGEMSIKLSHFMSLLLDSGYYPATLNLALCYLEGIGVHKNEKQALKYMDIAARKGVDGAQERLGCFYFDGDIVEQDYEKALRWLERAQKQNNRHSLYVIGLCYYYGYGVDEDPDEAFHYFKDAYELGSIEAKYQLGFFVYYLEMVGRRHSVSI